MANEVELKKESNVIPFDASLLLEDAGSASDNMTSDDMLIPRLRILQSGSPVVKKSDGAYVKGAEEGMIFDNVSNQFFAGETGITVVPVSYRRTFIEWSDDRKFIADHGVNCTALLDRCTDDGRGGLRTPEGNSLVNTSEYFVYQIDKDGGYSPAMISMSSSGIKKAKKWNSMMNRLQIPHPSGSGTLNPAMFWTAYQITTVPESNDNGSWFNWEISMRFDAKSGGIIQNLDAGKDIYLEAREFKKKVQSGDVNIKSDDIPF
mgnify:FL=1